MGWFVVVISFFGLLKILMGLFLVLFGFSLCYLGFFFCVIWVFVMCGECFNFRLFGLFAVLLIDLSSLIFFFLKRKWGFKTKMRMNTLANPYFLNLYISINFLFFYFFSWSHIGSASADILISVTWAHHDNIVYLQ